MNRRDFLGAISGSFALSMTSPYLEATAQERNTTRTIHETAAERLQQVYSYIPNTPEYEALALGDALWSDISKQFDAFGHRYTREDYFEQGGSIRLSWFVLGQSADAHFKEPGISDFVPMLAADQVFQLGDQPASVRVITGIDPFGPADIFTQKEYESFPFSNGTVYIHAEQDPLKRISWNRFAVLLHEGVLIWFDSGEQAHQYAVWLEQEGSSLADNALVQSQLQRTEPDAITYAWINGDRLNRDGGARRTLGVYAADETVEAYRDQLQTSIELEEQLFGEMPQVLSLMIGCDAGGLSGDESSNPSLVTGYDLPQAFVNLQFGTESDVNLAADIIEWRVKNALSWITREKLDIESYEPMPIDLFEARNGVLIQKFGDTRAADRIRGMTFANDLSLYGWGELS